MDTGQGFGEIALLYSVTRTATVAAASETTLLRVGREAFLTAMHAHPGVSAPAETVARELLGRTAARPSSPQSPGSTRWRRYGDWRPDRAVTALRRFDGTPYV